MVTQTFLSAVVHFFSNQLTIRMEENSPQTNSDQSQMSTPIAIIIAGALVAAAVYFGGDGVPSGTDSVRGSQPSGLGTAAVVAISMSDHIYGNPNAPIKIVEYSDLECPFCKRFHETMKRVVADSNGQVAWVYRNFPLAQLHPNAQGLAEAAECVASVAGNDAYWKFLDEIFATAPLNTPFPMSELDTAITKVATLAPVKACINLGTHKAKIAKEVQDAVASGGNGTPHNILLDKKGNPTVIQGAQPYEVVMAAVDKALK